MLNDFLAYGIDNHPIESVMRIQAVKRWHMIDTTRIQNLAEHSANVALLVMLIVRTAPMNDGSSHSIEWIFPSTGEAVMAALVHDLAEAFTGDIPTHSKRHLQGIARMEAGVVSRNAGRNARCR